METKQILPRIQDADLKGKIVLVRVDHNVVKNGEIHDPYRIDATMATLFHIAAKGGKMILMSHVGRPRNKETGEINISENSSIQAVVDYLQKKLSISLKIPGFYRSGKHGYIGIETSINHLIRDLASDRIDGIYLPNTRWFNGEEDKGEAGKRFAYQLAGLADVFINDAFGSWQAHASTVGPGKYLPSYAGLLMQSEIKNLNKVLKPLRPFAAVVAGAKFDTKIASLSALLQKADHLILGGVIYNAYLCAKYGYEINGINKSDLESAKAFVQYSEKYPDKILELPYIIEADSLGPKEEGKWRVRDIQSMKAGTKLNYVLDIAPESFQIDKVKQIFMGASTIFVNAVMGYAPYYAQGTVALDELIDENKNAIKLYGGGDTLQELKKLLPGLYIVALDSPGYGIFTGGGAVLKAIQEGSPYGLEPVRALIDNNRQH
jgi:phosphoglycerate kinase